VCSHFGDNIYAQGNGRPCDDYGGCSLCDHAKIQYIDELDAEDNVAKRLQIPLAERAQGLLRPEVEKHGDSIVSVTLFVPDSPHSAEQAALEMARHMGLKNPEVISRRVMHPAEGSLFEIKGILDVAINKAYLPQLDKVELVSEAAIETWVRPRDIHIVAATVGEDEHSVGLHEILDIKHGGIEKYGFHCHDLGTSVAIEQVVDRAVELNADAVLISTIVTHADVHKQHMHRLDERVRARGLRGQLVLIAGGTRVTDQLARECGMDAGFGHGTSGHEVASFLMRTLRDRESE